MADWFGNRSTIGIIPFHSMSLLFLPCLFVAFNIWFHVFFFAVPLLASSLSSRSLPFMDLWSTFDFSFAWRISFHISLWLGQNQFSLNSCKSSCHGCWSLQGQFDCCFGCLQHQNNMGGKVPSLQLLKSCRCSWSLDRIESLMMNAPCGYYHLSGDYQGYILADGSIPQESDSSFSSAQQSHFGWTLGTRCEMTHVVRALQLQ